MKHEKNKIARSRFNLNVREHERVNLLSTERCLWDTDNFTHEQFQCKASKREIIREYHTKSLPEIRQVQRDCKLQFAGGRERESECKITLTKKGD